MLKKYINKIKNNKYYFKSGIVFGSLIFSAVAALVIKLIMGNYLPKHDYGIFALGLTIFYLVGPISLIGLNETVAKYASKNLDNEKKYNEVVTTVLFLVICMSLLIGALLFLFSNRLELLFNMPGLAQVLKIFAIITPVSSLIDIIIYIFKSKQLVRPLALFKNVLLKLSILILILLIVLKNPGYLTATYSYTIAYVLVFVMLVAYCFLRKDKIFTLTRVKNVKKIILFSLSVFILTLVLLLLTTTDTIMVGLLTSSIAVANYSIAEVIGKNLNLFLTAFGFLIVPKFVKYIKENKVESAKVFYHKLVKNIYLIVLPFFLVMFLHSTNLLNLFFSNKYLESAVMLKILSLAFFIHVLFGPNIQVLIASSNKKKIIFVGLFVITLNIILNLFLISLYGAVGAAIATLVAYTAYNFIVYLIIKKRFKLALFKTNTNLYIKVLMLNIMLYLLIGTQGIISMFIFGFSSAFISLVALYFINFKNKEVKTNGI